jgi:predicted aldo/keto reductase-like oxidoreductase
MVYRQMGRTGVEVSALGYGCMRYPRKGGRVDVERTERQLRTAMDRGVNYFDTAWAYLGGQSETILGRVIASARSSAGTGSRELYVADKLPPYIIFSRRDMDRTLETMLKRLGSDRIDFLLAHMLSDFASWEKLKGLGYPEFLEAARASGKIRFAGFSWHGNKDEFKKVVDDYPWDFCQIQYNYMDEHYQAGREGLERAAAAGLGVVVMEPLRGGSLAGRLPAEVKDAMAKSGAKRSAAAWALDWIWDHAEVSSVLSGLNEEVHIEEDLALAEASSPRCLSAADKAMMDEIRSIYSRLMRVGCTGCSYCMPCPFGVDIPYAFSMLNALHLFRDRHARFQYSIFTSGLSGGKGSAAYLCTECGACEKKCPQAIEIRRTLKDVDAELSVKAFRPVAALLRGLRALRTSRKAG